MFYNYLGSYNWGPLTSTLVDILREKYRQRTFELLSNAYSIISIDTIAQHLGLSYEDATKMVKSHGWEEVEKDLYKPIPYHHTEGPSPNIKNLQSLTDYVVFLET